MAKLSVSQSNINYLEQVKQDLGLDSITKALHNVIQEHKQFEINTCTITT